MDCNRLLLLLSVLQELLHDIIWWGSSIEEIKLQMSDAILGKFILVILGLVKSNYEADIHFLEDGNIVFRCKRSISVCNIKRA